MKGSPQLKPKYSTEQELADHFVATLITDTTDFGRVAVIVEFPHPSGRADIVAQSPEGCVIAFETKLADWRGAMQQAYRNSTFAHYSYVVLPNTVARRVSLDAFAKRNIGLCSVADGRVTIELEAPKQDPLQPWITDLALARVSEFLDYGESPPGRACC